MRRMSFIGLALVCSCISVDLTPDPTLLSKGSIVLRGQASASSNASCPLWVADNGWQFVLFQDGRVSSEDFDAVMVPGTVSRLELKGRSDLGEPCVGGAMNAEVIQVLEINGQDIREAKLDELREQADGLIEDAKTRLSQKRDEFGEDLTELIDQAKTSLEARKDEIGQTLDEVFESIRDDLTDPDGTRDRFAEFRSDLEERIDDATGEFEEAKEAFLDDVRDRIDDFVDNLQPPLDERFAELRERIAELILNLPDLKESLDEVIDELRADLQDRLEEKHEGLQARLDELREQFEEDLLELIAKLKDRILPGPPGLPDPEKTIPPIFDEVLSDADELVADLGDKADEFSLLIRVGLGDVIDRSRGDSRQGFEDL